MFSIKEITKRELEILFENGIIKNSRRGIVNKHGDLTGFCTTRNKKYIENKYVNIARKLERTT